MKRISLVLLCLLWGASVHAAVIKTIQAGAVDQTVVIKIIDSTDGTPETGVVFNTSGIDLEYWRHGANSVTDITEATQTVSGAHADGGFVALGNGYYRLDLPDAAVAAGATAVEIMGAVTGMIVIGGTVDLSPPVTVAAVNTGAIDNADFATAPGASGGLMISGTNAGTTTLGALTVTGVTTFTGATTYTGAVTASNASNNFRVNGVAPGASGGLFIAGTNAATTITTGLTTNLTGNVSGSVGSVTGAVGSVTGAVGSVTAVSSGAITEASFATTAGSFEPLGIVDQGTAQAATGTTLQLRSAAAFADDEIIGATIMVTGGSTGVGQSRTITDYVSSTDTATVATWTTTPTGTITYQVYGTAASTGGGGGGDATAANQTLILAAIDAVDNFVDTEIAALTTNLATANTNILVVDDYVDTEVAAILVDTGTTLDDFIDTEIATLTTNLATLTTNVSTLDDFVDTEVAAIKAKTDQLTFGVTNQLDVNVESMNTNAMCGTGDSGTPWTGCP